MSLGRIVLAVVSVSAWSSLASAGEPADLAAFVERLEEQCSLELAGTVDAGGLRIAIPHGELVLDEGVLAPIRVGGADSTVLEVVFEGRGRLRVTVPDPVEQLQLEHFTGARQLEATILGAVLLLGDGRATAWLAERPRAEIEPEIATRLERGFADWTEAMERADAKPALLRAMAGDPAGADSLAVWYRSAAGRGYYTFDPSDEEPVKLGGLRLLERGDLLSRLGRKRLRRIEKQEERERQRKGAAAGEEIADEEKPGCGEREYDETLEDEEEDEDDDYDVHARFDWLEPWVATDRPAADPDAEPPGIEAEHYRIELTLAGDKLRAEGHSTIHLRPTADGLRVVELSLTPWVDVCQVTDQVGMVLPFARDDSRVLVPLAEPTVAGRLFELRIDFAGFPIRHWLGRHTQRDTVHWHPHAGHVDRATYDVTLRWPEGLELLAAGREVDGGAEAGQRWTRRLQDVRTFAFGFEVGDYELQREKAGHVEITFAFHRDDRELTAPLREELVRTVQASLLYFESQLGRLPIDQMVVMTSRRSFAQGLLGFITLREAAMHERETTDIRQTPQEQRLELIAHEMSHQWWGHMVGWDSYRDQWLSEGLADFSAAAFMQRIAEHPDLYLRGRAARWRAWLARTTLDGRQMDSTGPVVLGRRLGENYGFEAYVSVVYRKGAAVFSTLAQRLGSAETWKMLGTLAQAVNHRVIRTSTFFAALERMSGQELDDFVERYVHGTGLPVIFYDHAVRAGDAPGRSVVEGSIRQLPAVRHRLVLQSVGPGFDVLPRRAVEPDVSGWTSVIPFYVETEAGDGTSAPQAAVGTIAVRGERSTFEIPVDGSVEDFTLDPYGEHLAVLHAAGDGGAACEIDLADHLFRLGRLTEAETTLAAALERLDGDSRDTEAAREQRARAHLVRARMLLDAREIEPERVKQELRAAEEALERDSDFLAGERMTLEARLALRRGSGDVVLALIRGYLEAHDLALVRVAGLESSPLDDKRIVPAEVLALLAAAAWLERDPDAELLARLASLAGVEMAILGIRDSVGG